MKLSVVIVNWNSGDYLARLIGSLSPLSHDLEEVIVTPNKTSVQAGHQATVYAAGYDKYGNKIDIDEFEWSSLLEMESTYGYSATYTAPAEIDTYKIYAFHNNNSDEVVSGFAEIEVVPD